MIKQLQSIPTIFKGIMVSFLTVLMIRVTYPIVNSIMGLFSEGNMKIAATLGFYLILIFVCWVLLWVDVFKVNKEETKNGQLS